MAAHRPVVLAGGRFKQLPAGDKLDVPADWDALKVPAISAGVLTIDLATPAGFRIALNQNVTALSFANVPGGRVVVFTITWVQDATGGRTVAFPASVKADGGGAPVQPAAGANAVTVQSFYTDDGGVTVWQAAPASAVAGENLLINGDFSINQRGFPGGALSAGSYGHDRWGAYNGGANYSVSNGVVTVSGGSLCQPIETQDLGGTIVTFSVENPSTAFSVAVGNGTSYATATVPAGAGRQSVSLLVPNTLKGNIKLLLGGTSSFSRLKLERGAIATPWLTGRQGQDYLDCCRYYHRITGSRQADMIFSTGGNGGNSLVIKVPFPSTMRQIPAVSTNVTNGTYVAGPPSSDQWTLAAANVSFCNKSGTAVINAEGGRQVFSLYISGATFSPTPNQSGFGQNLYMSADAELACTD